MHYTPSSSCSCFINWQRMAPFPSDNSSQSVFQELRESQRLDQNHFYQNGQALSVSLLVLSQVYRSFPAATQHMIRQQTENRNRTQLSSMKPDMELKRFTKPLHDATLSLIFFFSLGKYTYCS